MLVNTTLPINAIAEAVGFSNPYYFSLVFKKAYLFSPKRYRIVQHDLQMMEGKTIYYAESQ
jgi:AraC-like DNA-binding protein